MVMDKKQGAFELVPNPKSFDAQVLHNGKLIGYIRTVHTHGGNRRKVSVMVDRVMREIDSTFKTYRDAYKALMYAYAPEPELIDVLTARSMAEAALRVAIDKLEAMRGNHDCILAWAGEFSAGLAVGFRDDETFKPFAASIDQAYSFGPWAPYNEGKASFLGLPVVLNGGNEKAVPMSRTMAIEMYLPRLYKSLAALHVTGKNN